MQWDPSVDMLVFNLIDIAAKALELKATKRNVVGVASRLYDPLGFLFLIIVCFKVLLW